MLDSGSRTYRGTSYVQRQARVQRDRNVQFESARTFEQTKGTTTNTRSETCATVLCRWRLRNRSHSTLFQSFRR